MYLSRSQVCRVSMAGATSSALRAEHRDDFTLMIAEELKLRRRRAPLPVEEALQGGGQTHRAAGHTARIPERRANSCSDSDIQPKRRKAQPRHVVWTPRQMLQATVLIAGKQRARAVLGLQRSELRPSLS